MDEQNNQSWENQRTEVKENATSSDSLAKKPSPNKINMTITISAIAIAIAVIVAVLIIVLGANGRNQTHIHQYGEWSVTKATSCTEAGVKERACSCGDIQTTNIPAAGHSFGQWTITLDATCTVNGTKERTCSCGEKETEAISALGHSFGNWITVQVESCTVVGIKERYCNCGEKETSKITSSHNWTKATCTTPKHCIKCGEISGEANGHNYKEGKCTICNERIQPKINIPSTPINLKYINLRTNHIYNKCTITSITYKIEWNSDGTYDLFLYHSGVKTYDEDGNSVYDSAVFNYKLCDSEGYSVETDYSWTPDVQVGEKYRDAKLASIYDLDPNQEYTLYLMDREI